MLNIRENDQFGASLAFSLISKKYKASLYALEDSLQRRIDIKRKLLLYSLTVELTYGHKIPEQYFLIDGVNRSDFLIGVGISPLVSMRFTGTTDLHAKDTRMRSLRDSILTHSEDKISYGLALSFKAGLTTLRNLPGKGAVELGVFYSLNWFDYFYHNGEQLFSRDIDPSIEKSKKISFISNRVEIGISLLRKTGNGKKQP